MPGRFIIFATVHHAGAIPMRKNPPGRAVPMKEGDKIINNPNAKNYTFDEFAEEMKSW